jgi:hypothetical protein
MPGPVVHTIIGEHLPGEFESASHGDYSRVADNALRKHRNALVYGCQGPDPFFFNPDDILPRGSAWAMTTWADLRSEFAVEFYKLTEPLTEVKREFKNNLDETLDQQPSQTVTEYKNLLVLLRSILSTASRIMGSFVKKTVLDKVDVFGLYISPLQKCGNVKTIRGRIEDLGEQLQNGTLSPEELGEYTVDHENWWWFDILHSRRTGDFVSELLDIAHGVTAGDDEEKRDRPLLKAYAIGYLSHLAADVVGHSYVNTITGGPYRLNQAQRHTTQEKIMDVWAYNRYYCSEADDEDCDRTDPGCTDRFPLELSLKELDEGLGDSWSYLSDELVDSGMHRNFQFLGGEIEGRDWQPDPERLFQRSRNKPITQANQLPDEIADNFALAAGRTYAEGYQGEDQDFIRAALLERPMDSSEVSASYRGWYKNFRSSTTTFSPPEPGELPASDLTGPLMEELNNVVDESTDVADAIREAIESIFDNNTTADLQDAAGCARRVVEDGLFGQEDVDCLEDLAESINNFIVNIALSITELLTEIADLLVALVKLVETAAATVKLRVWNFLLQKVYEGLFTVYKNILKLITAIGFGSMYSEDLCTAQLKNLWNPTAEDASGRIPRNYIVDGENARYPRKGLLAGHTPTPEVEDRLGGLENQAHLLVPFGEDNYETKQTCPGPRLYGCNTPEVFINDPYGMLFSGEDCPEDPSTEASGGADGTGGGGIADDPESGGSSDDEDRPKQGHIPHPTPKEKAELRRGNLVAGVEMDVASGKQPTAADYYPDETPDGVREPETETATGTEGGETPDDDPISDDLPLFCQPVLGDAVSFTAALYDRYRRARNLGPGETPSENTPTEERPIPNLNMSGDRAYGFPTWATDTEQPGGGCTEQPRERWPNWHGEEVPWLTEPIKPVFVPDPEEHY